MTKEKINKIWSKAKIVKGYDPTQYRQDHAGAWIERRQYGNIDHNLGWEADHIFPIALKGNNYLQNLQPLHWENNRYKGDNFPRYKTIVSSENNANIEKEQSWILDSKSELYQVLKELHPNNPHLP